MSSPLISPEQLSAFRARTQSTMDGAATLYRPTNITSDGMGSQTYGAPTAQWSVCRLSFGPGKVRMGGLQGEYLIESMLLSRTLWSVHLPFGQDLRHGDYIGVMSRVWSPLSAYALGDYAFCWPPTGAIVKCIGPGTSGRTSPDWTTGNVFADGSVMWQRQRWQSGSAYALSEYITPSSPNGLIYKCSVPGVSGVTEPIWPTAAGSSVTDGSITWVEASADWIAHTLDVGLIIGTQTDAVQTVAVCTERTL